MKIEILGTGCPKCASLTANAEAAAKNLGIAYELQKVTAISDIMRFGVMVTPAIVVNGQVKSAGKVLSEAEITSLLTTALDQ